MSYPFPFIDSNSGGQLLFGSLQCATKSAVCDNHSDRFVSIGASFDLHVGSGVQSGKVVVNCFSLCCVLLFGNWTACKYYFLGDLKKNDS